jgi:hypothetical protein
MHDFRLPERDLAWLGGQGRQGSNLLQGWQTPTLLRRHSGHHPRLRQPPHRARTQRPKPPAGQRLLWAPRRAVAAAPGGYSARHDEARRASRTFACLRWHRLRRARVRITCDRVGPRPDAPSAARRAVLPTTAERPCSLSSRSDPAALPPTRNHRAVLQAHVADQCQVPRIMAKRQVLLPRDASYHR